MAAPRLFPLFLRLLLGLAGACLLGACGRAGEEGPVVLAAASLQGALEETADAWAHEGHPRPLLAFAASSSLARQVADGAPADLFLSADREWIEWLERRGLLEAGSVTDLLGNRLVIVGARRPATPLTPGTLAAALGDDERLAMGDPQVVPAGRYARAALEAAGVWEVIEPRVAPSENVRAALALVERGEAPLGIVYRSDLLASSGVVEAGVIPERLQPKIVYPLARLAGSRHPDAAAFFAFLQSPAAARIFERHGFSVLAR